MAKDVNTEELPRKLSLRKFNNEWEFLYFFVRNNHLAMCLVCKITISTLKAENLNRHYIAKHSLNIDNLSTEDRYILLNKLKNELKGSSDMEEQTSLNDSQKIASLRIAHLIGQSMKPHTDGEYIKKCLVAAAEELHPAIVNEFSRLSLSPSSISRKIKQVADELKNSLLKCCAHFEYFSIALDESIDICDISQLAIFIRGVDSDFNVTEDVLDLVGLKDTTKGIDISTAVVNTLNSYNLDLSKLIGITTDGAPAMVGKNIGAVAMIKSHIKTVLESHKIPDLFEVHCLLHIENLCCQSMDMSHIMTKVIQTINFVKNNALRHRQFQSFMDEINAEYKDLIFFSKIRWLSRGKCLERFWCLRNEIDQFTKNSNMIIPELTDQEWLSDLAFSVDITNYLNELNIKLQGDKCQITDYYQNIVIFIEKLKLFERQLRSNNCLHFPHLNEIKYENKKISKYAEKIKKLNEEFNMRFLFLQKHKFLFEILINPFIFDVDMAPTNLQLELLELQCNLELKHLFTSEEKIVFYKKYINNTKYPNIKKMFLKLMSLFGTTYLCESFFSRLKYLKSKHRNRLTEENLASQMRVAITKLNIDYNKIIKK